MKPLRLLCVLLALLFAASPAFFGAQSKGTTSSKSKKSSAAKPKAAAKSSKSSKSSKTAKRSSARGKSSRNARRQPPSQRTPEPERVREIQQALADRGYPLEVSGQWDAASVAALTKFQDDQQIKNLTGRGKLDSLTLIALGLGPKHEPQTPPPPPTPIGQTP